MSIEIMEYSIIQSILAINPKAVISVEDNDVKKINWLETTPIDEEDILAKQKELKAEYEAKQYQRDRQIAYPSIGDQLDMIYKAGQGGEAFQKAIKAVKDKYPKG
jgi:hypothetical protein